MGKSSRMGNFRRVQAYNEGLMLYLYDDSLLETWRHNGDIDHLIRNLKSDDGFAETFSPGDLLACELRQDENICVDIAVRPQLTDEEMAQSGVLEPLTGYLCLPSGRLCVECANNFRFDPESDMGAEDSGSPFETLPGDYRVWIYHVDMDSLPVDEHYDYQGPFQIITLEPAGKKGIPDTKRGYLRFPVGKKAGIAKKPDTSWSGKFTLENGIFTGVFVHNYDVSGPCINFDRDAETAMDLKIGDRLVIEFDSAHIQALFLGNIDSQNPAAEPFAMIRNHTKCGFVTDREGIEKLMLFEFPDRDMMHFDFRKSPLYGTPVQIRRLN